MNAFINTYLSINFITLLWYSSEMKFMFNYDAKPDKWYLMTPFFSITFLYIILLIMWLVYKVDRKTNWISLVLLLGSYWFFLMTNTPGNQLFGYISIFCLTIIIGFIQLRKYINNKKL